MRFKDLPTLIGPAYYDHRVHYRTEKTPEAQTYQFVSVALRVDELASRPEEKFITKPSPGLELVEIAHSIAIPESAATYLHPEPFGEDTQVREILDAINTDTPTREQEVAHD